ncbi:hypothetical protein [Streptomyces iconiensis]|uniref:Uncharacterized protein n=1 Tax=Streptomyces iconiensis TaxID=1384038 RepID=A0ABT7AAU4_9ACTN|nr:hypothetical protein [Streptomyces iconiensis]MDJ1138466.1 hypothetical protein [Streptomyces iconiensis]
MAQPAQARDMAAERLGTQLPELDGLTHSWMLRDPERGAGVLRRFWALLGVVVDRGRKTGRYRTGLVPTGRGRIGPNGASAAGRT